MASREPDPARERGTVDRAWHVPALLLVIVGALVALVAVPYAVGGRVAAVRAYVSEVLEPARAAATRYERASALEVTAVRGYAATGDSTLLARYVVARREAERALAMLHRYAAHEEMGPALHVEALDDARRRWAEGVEGLLSGALPAEAYAAGLPEQQTRYEATLEEVARIDSLIAAERVAVRASVEQTDRRRLRLSVALALVALAAAAAALLLGRGLRRATRHLEALNASLEARVEERTAEVRRLASALTLAEQQERHELAAVLHDDLQQHLFGLQLTLHAAQEQAGAAAPLRGTLDRTLRMTAEAIGVTRRLSVDLSPPVLEGEGLREALDWLAVRMREQFGFAVEVRGVRDLPVPRPDVRVLLFQTVRELLFNAVKHSGCTEATVHVREEADALVVEVADGGVGFTRAALDDAGADGGAAGGLGLRRAHERLRLFDGTLRVVSAPGEGARVEVALPLRHLRDEA